MDTLHTITHLKQRGAPKNEQAKSFYIMNEDKIWLESLQIKKYPELSGISGGVSYLYFAEMYFLTDFLNEHSIKEVLNDIQSKSIVQSRIDDNPSKRQEQIGRHNEKYLDLRERAEQLGIWFPTVSDICKGDNVVDVITQIRSFTDSFLCHRID